METYLIAFMAVNTFVYDGQKYISFSKIYINCVKITGIRPID